MMQTRDGSLRREGIQSTSGGIYKECTMNEARHKINQWEPTRPKTRMS